MLHAPSPLSAPLSRHRDWKWQLHTFYPWPLTCSLSLFPSLIPPSLIPPSLISPSHLFFPLSPSLRSVFILNSSGAPCRFPDRVCARACVCLCAPVVVTAFSSHAGLAPAHPPPVTPTVSRQGPPRGGWGTAAPPGFLSPNSQHHNVPVCSPPLVVGEVGVVGEVEVAGGRCTHPSGLACSRALAQPRARGLRVVAHPASSTCWCMLVLLVLVLLLLQLLLLLLQRIACAVCTHCFCVVYRKVMVSLASCTGTCAKCSLVWPPHLVVCCVGREGGPLRTL